MYAAPTELLNHHNLLSTDVPSLTGLNTRSFLPAFLGQRGGGGYGGGIVPLYGVVIRGAIESGDRGQMENVRRQANDYLSRVDEVRAALQELESRM